MLGTLIGAVLVVADTRGFVAIVGVGDLSVVATLSGQVLEALPPVVVAVGLLRARAWGGAAALVVGLLALVRIVPFALAPAGPSLQESVGLAAAIVLAVAGGVAATTLPWEVRDPVPQRTWLVVAAAAVIVGQQLPSTRDGSWAEALGAWWLLSGSPAVVLVNAAWLGTDLLAAVLALRLPVAAGVGAAGMLALLGFGAVSPLLCNLASDTPTMFAPWMTLAGAAGLAGWIVTVRRGVIGP